jgi:RNAse (barnase) inhibitor barstar
MLVIDIDATNWRTGDDFYQALLSALGAPKDHGRNVNAVVDSVVWGGINSVQPPYTVRVSGMKNIPKQVREDIELVERCLGEARAEFQTRRGHDVEVHFEIK